MSVHITSLVVKKGQAVRITTYSAPPPPPGGVDSRPEYTYCRTAGISRHVRVRALAFDWFGGSAIVSISMFCTWPFWVCSLPKSLSSNNDEAGEWIIKTAKKPRNWVPEKAPGKQMTKAMCFKRKIERALQQSGYRGIQGLGKWLGPVVRGRHERRSTT